MVNRISITFFIQSKGINILKNVIFIFYLFVLSTQSANAIAKLNIGDIPPDYLGQDRFDEEVTLSSNKGKLVIISFWATWCNPCLKELPVLENIQNKLGKDNIKVVAINYRQSRLKFKDIRKKLSSFSLTLTQDRRGKIARKFGVEGVPHLFIVDKTGKLIFQQSGYGETSIDQILEVINTQLTNSN